MITREFTQPMYIHVHVDCLHHTEEKASLVPSPTPSFPSLLSTVLSSDGKLGVGLGTRLGEGGSGTHMAVAHSLVVMNSW